MKRWLVMLVIVGFLVPVFGCASADRDASSASPATSDGSATASRSSGAATDPHADCFRTGGTWHPNLKYCDYRAPDGTVPPMK